MSNQKYYEKSLPPQCGYCKNGRPLSDGEVFCAKKGLVNAADSCRSYRYDVLKRVPSVQDVGRKYKPEDFKI